MSHFFTYLKKREINTPLSLSFLHREPSRFRSEKLVHSFQKSPSKTNTHSIYIYINIRPFFLKYVFHNNLSYLSMGNSGSCPLITGYPSLCLGVDDVLLFPTTAKLIGELLVQQTTSQAASSAVRPTSKTSNLPRTIGKKV